MADYIYIDDTGVIIPDTDAVQTGVEEEYKLAFGQDLNVSPSTPQGMLIASEVLARRSVIENNAALANQINPNIAGGVFFDAIFALMGGQRNPNVSTTVVANLTGIATTVIAAGSQARDETTGLLYQSLDTVILNGDGEATVTFSCLTPGAFTCQVNDLNQVVSSILGWETVTNPAVGIPGSSVQPDASARNLRRLTLGLQGTSQPVATISAINELVGVDSCSYRENVTDDPITIDDVTLVPHSMYACVYGGDETEIAEAIYSKKSGGCNYNGDTSVTLIDPSSGQSVTVKFDRPLVKHFLVNVTVSADTSVKNPGTAVINAILAYQAGEIAGMEGLKVGVNVSCFELSGAIVTQTPGIFVHLIETMFEGEGDFSVDELTVFINQVAVTQISSIHVTVNS